jgi:hypothetical protein
VDYAAPYAGFLKQSAANIQLRIENLHLVLPELKEAQRHALVSAVKQYHWLADSTILDNCSADERPVLSDFQQQVLAEFKTETTIPPERLSELSWQALGQAFDTHPNISPALKRQVFAHIQTLHATAAQRAWVKGMETQMLFFLSDITRAVNTGQVGGLATTAGMLAPMGL